MKTNRSLPLIALLFLGLAAAGLAQNKSDELKRRILAQAQSISPDEYAFTRTIRSDQTSNGKTEKKVTIETFDPTKPAEARWTLNSVDNAPPSADALKEFRTDAAKRRVAGYYRLGGYFGTPATATTDAHGRTIFHFSALPKESVRVFDTDVSQNAVVDASVNETNGTSFVEQVHITLRPMRIKLLMKLNSYESTARYRIGPEGKPLLVEQTSDMAGSGMGRQGRSHTVITYSDYRAIRKEP
jgi:hypothetical protein